MWSVLKQGLELGSIAVLGSRRATYLAKSCSTTLHEVHAAEDVAHYGVAAMAFHMRGHDILGQWPLHHGAWRDNVNAIIVHVDMDLAAEVKVGAMDKRVHERLGDGALAIAAEVYAAVGGLLP